MPDMIKSVATDRGFDSSETRKLLDSKNIFNAICPRSIPAYIENPKTPNSSITKNDVPKPNPESQSPTATQATHNAKNPSPIVKFTSP